MEKKSLYIITGTSKGLGKALLNVLLDTPHTSIIGISRTQMESHANYTHHSIDLADTAALIQELDTVFPKGDYRKVVLINNAGWIGEIAHNGRLAPESLQAIYQINVTAPAILMNAFMQRYDGLEGDKLVVNISSGAAAKVIDGWSGYCASKAALNQMTQVAQHESDIADRGFRLYALSPGIIDTSMQEDIRSSSEENFSNLSRFRGFKEKNELSAPNEIAEKVLYLIEHHRDFREVLQDVRNF
ncbi:SDR family NAD(P)-dependent oxidoreductase [Negadavirga shengliensis]|uniref:SDR family NAD(P)-dependent oxidoreductase n=1 Tax=Negadavirga shengliensis TaxID=1389218 RepID=A0ABV9SZ78_9BACT